MRATASTARSVRCARRAIEPSLASSFTRSSAARATTSDFADRAMRATASSSVNTSNAPVRSMSSAASISVSRTPSTASARAAASSPGSWRNRTSVRRLGICSTAARRTSGAESSRAISTRRSTASSSRLRTAAIRTDGSSLCQAGCDRIRSSSFIERPGGQAPVDYAYSGPVFRAAKIGTKTPQTGHSTLIRPVNTLRKSDAIPVIWILNSGS